MESKLKKIREAVHNDFLVKTDDKWKKIELSEEDDNAKCKSVLFKQEKGIKTVVIKLDKQGKDIHPLFSTKKGLNNLKIKNDYLIFALKNKRLYALLIELKSGNTGKWIKQCKAGEVIAKYILGLVNNWADDIVIDINNFNFRYILFYTNSLEFKNRRKKNTKISSIEYIDNNADFVYVRKKCNEKYNLGMFCK